MSMSHAQSVSLGTLATDEPRLRVSLLARLAGALRDELSLGRRSRFSEQAVTIARELGEGAALAYALEARFTAIWGPDNLDELEAIAAEVRTLAEASGDRERRSDADWLSLAVAWTQGMPLTELWRVADEYSRLAEELKQPSHRWYAGVMRSMLLLAAGDFALAEPAIEETVRLGRRAQSWDALASYRLAMFVLRREQGRLGEIVDALRRSTDEYPGYWLFRCLMPLLDLELGRPGQARRELDVLAADGLSALPRDSEWLFGLAVLAEAAATLGAHCQPLHDLLEPHEALTTPAAGEVSHGFVARVLGLLDLALSRPDDAISHLQEAVRLSAAMGARPWVARAEHDLAQALMERDEPGDRERASSLVADACGLAGQLGMPELVARLELLAAPEMKGRTDGQRSVASANAWEPSPQDVFRRQGEYWTIVYQGQACRLRDAKGLRYLVALLGQPGREVHALDLVAAAAATPAHGASGRSVEVMGGGRYDQGAGPLLDNRARAAYRRRVEQLTEDIEEAAGWGDTERAARATAERDFLLQELSRAIGLGGRDRAAASASERARLSVTRAIKTAVDRIALHSPAFADHLRATVRTGRFCSYTPDPRAPVAWRL